MSPPPSNLIICLLSVFFVLITVIQGTTILPLYFCDWLCSVITPLCFSDYIYSHGSRSVVLLELWIRCIAATFGTPPSHLATQNQTVPWLHSHVPSYLILLPFILCLVPTGSVYLLDPLLETLFLQLLPSAALFKYQFTQHPLQRPLLLIVSEVALSTYILHHPYLYKLPSVIMIPFSLLSYLQYILYLYIQIYVGCI